MKIKDWWVAAVTTAICFIDALIQMYQGQYDQAYNLFIAFMGWAGFTAYRYEEQVVKPQNQQTTIIPDESDHVCELNTGFGHHECLICGKKV